MLCGLCVREIGGKPIELTEPLKRGHAFSLSSDYVARKHWAEQAMYVTNLSWRSGIESSELHTANCFSLDRWPDEPCKQKCQRFKLARLCRVWNTRGLLKYVAGLLNHNRVLSQAAMGAAGTMSWCRPWFHAGGRSSLAQKSSRGTPA